MPSGTGMQNRWWASANGQARALQRPDGKWQVQLPTEAPDAWPDLVAELRRDVAGAVITAAPADDDLERPLRAAGLLPARRIQHWIVPTG